MTRHSCSTSSSSLNLPSDCESHASPCSSSPSPSPSRIPPHDISVPHSTNVCFEKLTLRQPDSNFAPLPLPPSQAQLLFHPKSTKLSSQSFIRRRSKSVSADEGDDPFVLALKTCTHREEEEKYHAKGEKASYGGLHTMFMGLLKPGGRKTYGDVEAPKSANPLLNLLQFATSKKKQVVLSDLLGCKTTSTHHLHFHVVHPSLIYRKRPTSLPL